MIRIRREDLFIHRTNDRPFINLHLKMIGLIGALSVAIILLIGGFMSFFVTDTLETQIGKRALSVAKSVAVIPEISQAFDSNDPSAIIQPIVQKIQAQTDAEFIVVGNQQEIRYAHPSPDRIGNKMIGEDNERALSNGESYISKSIGSLGSSLRAKAPVYLDGEIVGVVSVGFLVGSIESIIWEYSQEIWLVLLGICTAAIIGAVLIANYIKKVLFGLEPEEISHLLFQKETILHSIHEGIIATNKDGLITMINSTALKLLTGGEQQADDWIGKPIQECFPNSDLPYVLEHGKSVFDQERLFNNHIVYVNSAPIFYEHELLGAVATFRNKTEIENLTKRLAHIQQYANALRSQTHEFSNKLYTIMGLTQLNKKDDVLDFIQEETNIQQHWTNTLLDNIDDPYISGLLVGKLSQASELQINVSVQPDSQLHSILSDLNRQALLTAIGNLLDNAFDAVYDERAISRDISISFTDIGQDLLFEIDDAGPGIDEASLDNVLSRGFSTKDGAGRGFGLALTKNAIEAANGQLSIEPSELGGTYFVVSLPKDK
ncbi:histidine kinase [Sporosarcina sp. P21c]|uniref:ATP-binding protein n=1 Tax=unclassified Sporosarcina TaxID=2647733 RepID=UPI000C170A81|nr:MULTISPECIES: sensor histidine kinase [unclassified Sporosarcina]PIC68103.1 histidine kinase [Sporosarcina sp. P16a]PIC89052.1 histidine kinase [Sporosarcina sp. P21c]PIC94412.1 histidine kinase [Sporosarcina sp. P25]